MLRTSALALAVAGAWLLTDPMSRILAQATDKDWFPAAIERDVGNRKIKLVRTGTAYRTQLGFKVYAVASYVQEGAKVRTAEELAAADSAKQLHLVFLRNVAGDEMAQTFRTVLRQNYPAPAFTDEVKQLTDLFEKTTARKGDHIWITHVPKVGLHCRRQGKEDLLIRSVGFSKAVWDNYLGENNVGETVKRGLTSEL